MKHCDSHQTVHVVDSGNCGCFFLGGRGGAADSGRTTEYMCLQTAAEAEAKQADIRSKHLQKQLAEQQKGLHSKEQEAKKLQHDLAKEQSRVQACLQQ